MNSLPYTASPNNSAVGNKCKSRIAMTRLNIFGYTIQHSPSSENVKGCFEAALNDD